MADGLIARALRTPEGRAGGVLMACVTALAAAAAILFPDDPLSLVGRPLLPPFERAMLPLGTDRLGRDVLAGIVHGARTSLVTGVTVLAITVIAGAVIGTLAGYAGRWIDDGLMRLADAVQTVPALVIALAVVSIAGPTRWGVIAALSAGAWTGPARVIRAQVMALKGAVYVDASRLSGRSLLAIAFAVILPNAIAPLVALCGVIVANAIIMEAALAFLGLADPNSASWGAMIAEGRQVMRTAPHLILAPGIAVCVLVLGVNLLGEAMTRALAAERD
ncbi:MAG: ABC transporter permease [Beijerinckiaceae bacterium]